MQRCKWCLGSEIETAYHDTEWGVPLHNDSKLFEFILLDSFQAGLSWKTILNKRDNFRLAFDDFNAEIIATYGEDKVTELLHNAGIVRNKLKINAAISNAECFLKIQSEFGTFDKFIWKFTDGKPLINSWQTHSQIPVSTKKSDAMSKELKNHGFKFVGTTICYAFMQAAGMVNDHTTDCFRYTELI
ncbi:MAG: DNA-3-methyladenine glycosylase I [Candidatus Kapabacteria bacterium]|nr:DNA-3-methyladenine glycosylase I [Ignavibacteriota bacterium]MCW5884070.1 DNA-3-methyladenine glycosylase I [Candidatus Kapabacteria bacterium]